MGETPCFSSGLEDRRRKQLLLGWLGEEEEEEGKGEEEENFPFPSNSLPFLPLLSKKKRKREKEENETVTKISLPPPHFEGLGSQRGTVIAPKFDGF